MTEQQIQTKKIKELEADGYFVIKLIKTNKNGIPDVLALHPDYGIEFYEIKTKKGKVSKLQEYPNTCLLYTSPSPRDRTRSRMPSSA